MLKNKLLLGFFIFVLFVFSFTLSTNKVNAAAGDIQVTVTQEADGAALSGATVLVRCTGGAYTALTGSPTTNGSGIVSAAPQGGSSCAGGDTVDIQVAKDGYVTNTSTGAGTYVALSDPNTYTVSGVQFGFKVTGITDELSSSITSATVLTGDAYGTTCSLISGAWYCAVPLANTGIVVSVAKSGYVTNTATSFASDRTLADDAQRGIVVAGIQYAQKVTITRESSGALTGATVTAGSSHNPCLESGSTGIYYCPVPSDQDGGVNDISITKTGYVTNTTYGTSNRAAADSVQGTVAATGILFQLKVIVTDQLGTALVPTSPTFNSVAPTLTSSNTLYWAVNGDHALVLNKDGYVNNATTNAGYSSVTTAASGQVVITLDSGSACATAISASTSCKGLVFGLKVTVTERNSGSIITGAAVSAGDSYGTSCVESGSTGVYYCAIPLANTGTIVKAINSGHSNEYENYVDRTVATDAQSLVAVQLGTGGGGALYSGGVTPAVTPSVVTPSVVTPPVVTPPVVTTPTIPEVPTTPTLIISPEVTMTPVTYISFTKAVNAKSTVAEVKNLQKVLNTSLKLSLKVDGKFGKETTKAVKAFQKANKITPVNGLVGPKTRAALNITLVEE